jgi:hypothetical protein
MSLYVRNQQCDMCKEVEKTLCRINVGKIDHMICYGCMAKLTADLVEFASMNCVDELEQMGVEIKIKKKNA